MGVVPVLKKNLSQSAKENLRTYLNQLQRKNVKKLPPETELAKMLSVSRATIRQALDDLEREGLLLRIHGRGTFLNPAGFQVRVNMGRLLEFDKVIQNSGYRSSSELISMEEVAVPEYAVKPLILEENSSVYRVTRVYYADQTPAIYSLAYIPVSLFDVPPAERDWEKYTNFEMIRKNAGRLIMRDRVEISTETRESAENVMRCSMAEMPASILCLDGCSFDQENRPVILGSAFYNTDLVRFQLVREMD